MKAVTYFWFDSIQFWKKLGTNAWIQDPVLNQACHDFIDGQTKFAKGTVDWLYNERRK
jgi:hypothetical protein